MNSEKSNDNNTVNLLWTGGWDSTFRLLEVVLKEKREVQPYYIIFKDRWSYKKELKTMQQIKKIIQRGYPSLTHLIKDTIIVDEKEVILDDYIASLHGEFKNQINFGTQYKTIVCFAKQFEMTNLELGITKDGKISKQISPYVIELNNKSLYQIDKSKSPKKIYSFYKYFNFPLFNYNKSEMGEIARKMGWTGILKNIWICHKPVFGKFPCGGCGPCLHAAEDEFAKNRIPLISRVIGPQLKKIYNSKYYRSIFK